MEFCRHWNKDQQNHLFVERKLSVCAVLQYNAWEGVTDRYCRHVLAVCHFHGKIIIRG